MPSASNAAIQYEAAQRLAAYAAMVDAGDHLEYGLAASSQWSRRSGYAPSIRPNGIITGGIGSIAASGSDNVVDSTALTCYLIGVSTSVGAGTDLSITRGVTTDTHRINSITVNSGGALAVVSGVDHTAFSEIRGADGGPPWIPTGSVEVFQVRTTSVAAAAVTSSEIYQIPGTHREPWNYPLWDEFPIGDSTHAAAYINFNGALGVIHSDDAGSTSSTKKVYGQVYTPDFATLPIATDFVPPEESFSVSSTQVYRKTIAAASSSLGQGSFTAYLNDGVTDALVGFAGENLIFKFFPDEDASPFILCQGSLGTVRAFPAGDSISAACTISADQKGVNKAS